MNIRKGFTLIELLIVVAIIGILASTVLISLNIARDKASNVRTFAQVSQGRNLLEQGYVAGYSDLVGSLGHNAGLTSGGPDRAELILLFCTIASQNGFPTTVADDLNLDCDGSLVRTGVVIYTNSTGPNVLDYAVYATTTPTGYACIDSFGNSVSTTTASIPAYTALMSTSTALCQ